MFSVVIEEDRTTHLENYSNNDVLFDKYFQEVFLKTSSIIGSNEETFDSYSREVNNKYEENLLVEQYLNKKEEDINEITDNKTLEKYISRLVRLQKLLQMNNITLSNKVRIHQYENKINCSYAQLDPFNINVCINFHHKCI